MITIRDHASDSADELDAITAIYSHHVRHGRASFETEPPSAEEMRGRLCTLLDTGYPVLVAIINEVVVGYAYAGPYKTRSAYRFTVEDSIYIHHEHLRKGIGKALLSALIDSCKARDYKQVLAVIGDSDNQGSIGLHRSCGFVPVGTARDLGFKFGRWLDVVNMQLSL